MQKQTIFPDDADFSPFYPGSVVLITAVDSSGKADICTVGAWALVNGVPNMFGIAMCARPSGESFWKRYTTTCIEQTGEFVINIPHAGLAEDEPNITAETDYYYWQRKLSGPPRW